jgi:flagellar biosynthesis anti-sigma factor FlgM
MRIDLKPATQSLHESSGGSVANPATAGSSSAGNVPAGANRAELSGLHAQVHVEVHVQVHVQVQALVAQASQLPEVREARVQALRQAIQRGHYQSSPEEVAGAVLAHMIAGPAA